MFQNVVVPEHLKGYPFKTCQVDLHPSLSYSSFVKNPKGRTADEKFVSNPLVTDVTLREQCELQYLFQQNPDITGLSLVADDAASKERTSSISVEDFLPAQDHYDIFDLAAFIENAKNQFNKLPVKLRMMYNNNPVELCADLEKNYSAALANMQQFFDPILPESQSSATASRQGASSPNASQADSVSSDASNNNVKENVKENK